jgi:hypothetical protein
MHLCVWLAEMSTRQGTVPPKNRSLSAAAARVTAVPTIAVRVTGKRQKRLLQSECRGTAAEKTACLPEPELAPPNPSPAQENEGHGWDHDAWRNCKAAAKAMHTASGNTTEAGGKWKIVYEESVVQSQQHSSKQTDSSTPPPPPT